MPGEIGAMNALSAFISRIGHFEKERNDPSLSGERASGVRARPWSLLWFGCWRGGTNPGLLGLALLFLQLSPYLHFGHLAPQRAALEVSKHQRRFPAAVTAFLEELIVRRELAENFCHYNPRYDDLNGLYPQNDNNSWAQVRCWSHSAQSSTRCVRLVTLLRCSAHGLKHSAAFPVAFPVADIVVAVGVMFTLMG